MKRLVLGAVALVLPLLPAAPAYAVDNVICVGSPAGPCDENAASISAAITVANGNSGPDTILVGPGTYTDGPYQLHGSVHPVTLRGSGQDSTILTLPASATAQAYVNADHASVEDLSVQMEAANSSNDKGLFLSNSSAERVSITGLGTQNAIGIHAQVSTITAAEIQMPPDSSSGNRGVYSEGGMTVTDTDIAAGEGHSHSGPGTTDTLARITIRADNSGISTDGGTIDVDNTLIDLGSGSGVGLAAVNNNSSATPKAINANHVTIVGGGANSIGAQARAENQNAVQLSSIQLDNSIVRGPATDLVVTADNNGTLGGTSTATITTSYSNWSTKTENAGDAGNAEVVSGPGHLDVDPEFADPDAGDYRLTPGSPVVDQGDPSAGGPALDLDGNDRVVDGDGDETAVRDLGAYELSDTTAPETTLVSGPSGPTKDTTPTFTFTSEPGATFECAVDAKPFAACSGPGRSHTTEPLTNGPHTFRVRAIDAASNTDPTPANRGFVVDTIAPQTTIRSKPATRVTKRKVKLGFSSNETGVTFACKLDKKPWRTCTSPARLKVKVGKHRFSVRATDAAGNTDATPATYRFRRVPRSG